MHFKNVSRRSWYELWGVMAIWGLAALVFAGGDLHQDGSDARLRPSSNYVASAQYDDFADYIQQTQMRLETDKVFMDSQQKDKELNAATPFELAPAQYCQAAVKERPRRGILLIHGLSDMPLAMRDLAQAFSSRCFLVRVILLPGHGTRAGDLLTVSRQDWLEATHFALTTLKKETDQVFVGGFSLGGLLAVHVALNNADVDGVFAFSPALALENNGLLRQTVWLRHIMDWADRDAQDDYARYEAIPFNALAETYQLTQNLAQLLQQRPVSTPIFIAQSADDSVIDPVLNQHYFSDYFIHPHSRLLVYQPNPQQRVDAVDERIRFYNSFLPAQKVVNFSHQALHIAPNNPHYGINGDYRNCDDDRSVEALKSCLAALHPWRGEIYGDNSADLDTTQAMARLTYNPRFDELLNQIDDFLATFSKAS